jgi:hypothetical protein
MIYSVSGKLGSGKDTVAKIIQDIEPGKWKIKKWAGKLKLVATMLTGVPVEMWEDQDFKYQKMTSEWGNMTYREFLQKLGTDGLREGLHKNVWVNALMADYFPISQCDREGFIYPNWLITDTRFPNEAEAVKKARGVSILVRRPCAICGELGTHLATCGQQYLAQNQHPSETSLDSYSFDYTIDNVGTLEELEIKVKDLLNNL